MFKYLYVIVKVREITLKICSTGSPEITAMKWPLFATKGIQSNHTGCLDPKKILSTIDAPPGVPGVSKNHIFFSTNETVFPLC